MSSKMTSSPSATASSTSSRTFAALTSSTPADRPVGDEFTPAPGSLEAFLVEREALYAVPRPNRVHRGDIHHEPWRIRPAEAVFTHNTMADAAVISLPERAPLLHYAARQEVLVWAPKDPSSD